MSNDLNNGFEKLIRDTFEDYRIPVDPGNWDAIEKSLIKSRRIKHIYIAASFVAVAAATVLLLITLNLPKNDGNRESGTKDENVLVQERKTPKTPETQTKKQNPVPETATQTAPETKTEQKRQDTENQTQPESNSAPAYIANAETLIAQIETSEPQPEDPPLKEQLKFVPRNISGTSINLSSSNKLQLPGNDMRLSLPGNRKPDDKKNDNPVPDNISRMAAKLDKNKDNNKEWSILMSFGAGNYQSPNATNKNSNLIMAEPLLTSSKSTDYIKNKYKNGIMVPDNADTKHGLPLSAKFIVRKDLNSRLAVESGLSYTYLSTKYRWNNNTATQHLHYLGIPLNAVCYMVSKPNWNVYASAGGMVEKGVYSYIDRSDKITSKTNMKGLQWSVNGSVGVAYKLSRSLGLFFEPQVGYFFNNGQPESIRTDWPVSFGLGVGLRFSL
ncbi:MAG: porin family protein [Prevotellaceae bacterium]|jgi:hypothetical protein|nr:porin family protein [Prevotellaceae bacterium]